MGPPRPQAFSAARSTLHWDPAAVPVGGGPTGGQTHIPASGSAHGWRPGHQAGDRGLSQTAAPATRTLVKRMTMRKLRFQFPQCVHERGMDSIYRTHPRYVFSSDVPFNVQTRNHQQKIKQIGHFSFFVDPKPFSRVL